MWQSDLHLSDAEDHPFKLFAGRKFVLTAPLSFLDSQGVNWEVPAGFVTNFGSIPWPLWFVYPPTASVKSTALHDWFCENEVADTETATRVFYEALLAESFPEKRARLFARAVKTFGPRWGRGR